MKNSKKGFTLVELLVVIAILAILASVSVVGYTKFIEKAAKSNDDALATQINVLINGEKISQRQDTFEELALSAILKPALGGPDNVVIQSNKYGYDIYWNEDINEFVLITIEEGTDKGWQTLLYILGLQQSITPPDTTEPDIVPTIPETSIPDGIIVDSNKIVNLEMNFDLDSPREVSVSLDLSQALSVTAGSISNVNCTWSEVVTYYDYIFEKDYLIDDSTITLYRPGVYKFEYSLDGVSDYRYVFVKNRFIEANNFDVNIETNGLLSLSYSIINTTLSISVEDHLHGIKISDYDDESESPMSTELFNNQAWANSVTIVAKINDQYRVKEMSSNQTDDQPYEIVFENIELTNETKCEIYFRYLGMDGIWHNSQTHEITIQ